jgi:hypothetical protein
MSRHFRFSSTLQPSLDSVGDAASLPKIAPAFRSRDAAEFHATSWSTPRGEHRRRSSPRSIPPLPAGSIYPSGAALERTQLSQSLINIGAVCSAILLVSMTGLGIAAAVFVALFV